MPRKLLAGIGLLLGVAGFVLFVALGVGAWYARREADREIASAVEKAHQAGEPPATRAGPSAGSGGASPARAGDSRGSELGTGSPLAECPGRSYFVYNGDVDASKLRRWDDHV